MSKQRRWFLPTNTENLEFFLSSSLILDIDGFNKDAYIKDVMDGGPAGYIPFFSEDNLENAINKAREEDENLTCCIIELDLSQIQAMIVYAEVSSLPAEENKFFPLEFGTADMADDVQYTKVQIPAPLPLQCIKRIIFEDQSRKDENTRSLERKFGKYPNKIFMENSKLFKERGNTNSILPSESSDVSLELIHLPDKSTNYNKTYSLGGMLALMFYQTKNGRRSVANFKEACDLKVLTGHDHKEFELSNNYFYTSGRQDEEYGLLYLDLLSLLSKDKGSIGEIKYEILNYLDSAENFTELKVFVEQTAKILRSIEERTLGKSPEEYFTKLMATYDATKENKKIFMLLVMYFFRDNTETMLKFYHDDFNEIDYILFSMFFGMGCRYIGLPEHIKKIKGLGFYISNRMAEYHHKTHSGCVHSFKTVTPPKFVIGGLIKNSSNGEQDKFVEWFSSEFLKLDSLKFQSWECRGKEFSCDSNTILQFKEEPKISTMVNDSDIIEYYFNSGDEIRSEIENNKSFVNLIKNIFEKYKFWEIKNKSFSCASKSTLKYKEKPKLTSLIDMSEFEQQIIRATVGNDKDLFDYNKIYEQRTVK